MLFWSELNNDVIVIFRHLFNYLNLATPSMNPNVSLKDCRKHCNKDLSVIIKVSLIDLLAQSVPTSRSQVLSTGCHYPCPYPVCSIGLDWLRTITPLLNCKQKNGSLNALGKLLPKTCLALLLTYIQ